MIITINKVYDNNIIEVSSLHGNFSGKYFGKTVCVGKKCDVEVEISKVFSLDDLKISDSNTYNIFTSNGFTTITGIVQEIDNDILYIKFDSDLIVIEILFGIDYQSIANKFVSFTIDNIKLYDTGLLS